MQTDGGLHVGDKAQGLKLIAKHFLLEFATLLRFE
jgi:hypothetical protein